MLTSFVAGAIHDSTAEMAIAARMLDVGAETAWANFN
jgi:hypothetical protein